MNETTTCPLQPALFQPQRTSRRRNVKDCSSAKAPPSRRYRLGCRASRSNRVSRASATTGLRSMRVHVVWRMANSRKRARKEAHRARTGPDSAFPSPSVRASRSASVSGWSLYCCWGLGRGWVGWGWSIDRCACVARSGLFASSNNNTNMHVLIITLRPTRDIHVHTSTHPTQTQHAHTHIDIHVHTHTHTLSYTHTCMYTHTQSTTYLRTCGPW